MNLIVALVILLALAASQWQHPVPTSDPGWRLVWIGLVTALVPGLAACQTWWFKRRTFFGEDPESARQQAIRHLTVAHTAVWLTASLAIICALRWHEVVRFNWQWADWFAVDELLILCPVILSLLASWAVFHDLNRPATGPSQPSSRTTPQRSAGPSRLSFVALRARIDLLLLSPVILLTIATLDLGRGHLLGSGLGVAPALGLAVAGLAWLLPVWLQWAWATEPLTPAEDARFVQERQAHGLLPHQLRRWKTGGQVVNACAVGLTRGTRRILLSDGLLRHFPDDEARAILRHELAHLEHHHAWIRIAMLWAPLIGLALAGQLLWDTPLVLEEAQRRLGWTPTTGYLAAGSVYTLLTLPLLALISRHLEYQADQEAAGVLNRDCGRADPTGPDSIAACQALVRALRRLEIIQGADRASWMHPSLASRQQRLRQSLAPGAPKPSATSSPWSWAGLSLLVWLAGCSAVLALLPSGPL